MHLTHEHLTNPVEAAPTRKRSPRRWLLAAALVALALGLLPEVLRVTLGSNFHSVVPARFYRAAQPSAVSLKNYINAHGIRTVINLRGSNPAEEWFNEEVRIARECGVQFVSVNLSASEKPREREVRKLVDTIDQCPMPIFVHCNSGSDRSGFASACFLLLKTDATLDEARAQLSLRFGHFPWGRAACQGQILDKYKEWLDGQHLSHQPTLFRTWAREIYEKDDWPEGWAFGEEGDK